MSRVQWHGVWRHQTVFKNSDRRNDGLVATWAQSFSPFIPRPIFTWNFVSLYYIITTKFCCCFMLVTLSVSDFEFRVKTVIYLLWWHFINQFVFLSSRYIIFSYHCVCKKIPPKRLGRYYEILCLHTVGLRINLSPFFRPLNDMVSYKFCKG